MDFEILHFTNKVSCATNQGRGIHEIANNTIIVPAVAFTGLNAHLNLLEDFSPARNDDPFRWIPQGLFYDLADDRNDNTAAIPPRVLINDNVIGYTNQQLFDAIDSDITNIPAYRQRLLNENNNNQATNVTALFGFYNY